MYWSSSVYKQNQSATVLNKYVGGFSVRGQQVTEGSLLDYGITFWPEATVYPSMMDLFLTNMQLFFNLGTGVVWITCDVFISCLGSHSDGTHSLQRIHWWASDVILHFSKSVLMNKLIYIWMTWGWIHFHFCMNYSFSNCAGKYYKVTIMWIQCN